MAERLYKPGEDDRPRGEYIEVGPRGGQVSHPRQVTIDPGDRQIGRASCRERVYVLV